MSPQRRSNRKRKPRVIEREQKTFAKAVHKQQQPTRLHAVKKEETETQGPPTWKRACGPVLPTHMHYSTYSDLRRSVRAVRSPDLRDFHVIFDHFTTHFLKAEACGPERLVAGGKAQRGSVGVGWTCEYTNYLFFACQYFVPREPFGDSKGSDYVVFYGRYLDRDSVIAWIMSLFTGAIFGRKIISSRMQTLCDGVCARDSATARASHRTGTTRDVKRRDIPKASGLKPDILERLIGTYRKEATNFATGQGTTATLDPKGKSAVRTLYLHPFLAFLLQIPGCPTDLGQALSCPEFDVSRSSPPKAFLLGWEKFGTGKLKKGTKLGSAVPSSGPLGEWHRLSSASSGRDSPVYASGSMTPSSTDEALHLALEKYEDDQARQHQSGNTYFPAKVEPVVGDSTCETLSTASASRL